MSGVRLNNITLSIYALPELLIKYAAYPVLIVLPAFYAKNTAADLATIGIILFFSRILDAITDPLVGHLSDKTKSRFGSHKPWVIAGSLVTALSAYFLFQPTSTSGNAYFGVWYLIFFSGWTLIAVPYFTWGSELSRDYHERSRIVTFRSFAANAGGLLFLLTPFLPVFTTVEVTSELISFSGTFTAFLLPVAAITAVSFVPQAKKVAVSDSSFLLMLKSFLKNKVFLYFVVVMIFSGSAMGITLSLLYIYVDSYLLLGEKFIYLTIIGSISGLPGVLIWSKIIKRVGKNKAWAYGLILNACISPLVLILEPGPDSFYPFMWIVILGGMSYAVAYVAPVAILGDIIDYDILKWREDRAAKFFSSYTFIYKLNIAIGSGLSLFLLGLWGYSVQGDNSEEAVQGLKIIYVYMPVILNVIAAVIIYYFPLTERRHKIIQRRVESRGHKMGT